MRERQIKAAMFIQKKAIEALEMLNVAALSPKEILSFIIEASKLERYNRYEEAELDTSTGKTTAEGVSGSLASLILEAYERRKREGN